MNTIVTIDRQFGSGGKEVGIRVAKELGIPFYDEEKIRSVSNMNQRLSEIARLGFKRCIIPETNAQKLEKPKELEICCVKTLREAIGIAL